MEPDMDVSFDPYWQTADLIFEDPPELDLGGVSSMYAPADDDGSLSGLPYSSYDDSSSLDGASSSCLTADAAYRPSPPAAKTKNVGMERDRRRRRNDKLYALRGLVPNITKMDKASVIQDAIAYIEQLQEEERRMLAEVHALEYAVGAATVKTENLSSTGVSAAAEEEETVGGVVASPERKKMSRSAASIYDVHPVQILEVSEIGEKMAVISLRYYKTRDAMANVCMALETLRLRVMTASVTTVAGGTAVHTIYVQFQREKMGGAQKMKEAVQAAIDSLSYKGRLSTVAETRANQKFMQIVPAQKKQAPFVGTPKHTTTQVIYSDWEALRTPK